MNIIEKIKRLFRKSKKALAIGGTVATVGLATGCGAENDAQVTDNNVKVEQSTDKTGDFRKGYEVPQSEMLTIENEVEELETPEEVLNYIKDMYIEEYEKITEDQELTTEDIGIMLSKQNYVYKRDDGLLVTHGETPYATERAIKEDGYSYKDTEIDEVYTVRLKDSNKVIDAMTINNSVAEKVIPGDNYNEMKDYVSTLAELNQIIPAGFDYMEELEFGNQGETAKDNLINAIKDMQDKQKNKEQSQNSTEEKGIEDR